MKGSIMTDTSMDLTWESRIELPEKSYPRDYARVMACDIRRLLLWANEIDTVSRTLTSLRIAGYGNARLSDQVMLRWHDDVDVCRPDGHMVIVSKD